MWERIWGSLQIDMVSKAVFEGCFHRYDRPEDKWAYLAFFLHTTLTAPIRQPYLDLRRILNGKDYFILTTNQDTQAIRTFPEDRVAETEKLTRSSKRLVKMPSVC
ncbi:MAG: hypothetical protein LIO80_09815 [Lachnospiraceae bacterium]|nr:hypothetical protein [Lachnospiraceae bacterium]